MNSYLSPSVPALFETTDPRPVHFMGIGGAGMSALAMLARRRGLAVTGCDTDVGGAADLVADGVRVSAGHDAAHVAGCRAVVVTAAVPTGHPELEAARAAGIPVVPRKVALAELIGARRSVALAGTHGKTTTTVMTTLALGAAGFAPTGLAGGRVAQWGGNALPGDDTLFVVEADEYDQAFLTLHPTVAVVNNVEPDHLECYGDFAALEAAFATFAGRAPVKVICADDAGARRLATRLDGDVRTFGTAADATARFTGVTQSADGTTATLHLPGAGAVPLTLRVPGLHNLRNAGAALTVVDALGGDVAGAARALGEFTGVGRRFERLGETRGIEIVDDYAHHPTEVAATLEAARQRYPARRIVAVFQPHLYSRTQAHGAALGEALRAADVAIVADVYGAREQPITGVTGALVADAAQGAATAVRYVPRRADLLATVAAEARSGDVVLTLGAGDVTKVGRELAQWLAARA
jgi:UDP-N-acetylmuramate--alanine ligase